MSMASHHQTTWCYSFEWFELGSTCKLYLCESCSTAVLPETGETCWVIFRWTIVFLSDGNQTCTRIWMCSLAPRSNCCSVPKVGIFAEEGPQNHPPDCIRYAIWFCVCVCWGTIPFCSKTQIGEKIFSLDCETQQLFTWPSSLTTRLKYYFSTSTTHRLSYTTDQN